MKALLLAVLLLVAVVASLNRLAVAQPHDGDEMKKLNERVEALETAVIKNPAHPQKTVLVRLESLEEHFQEVRKADLKETESVRRILTQLQKDSLDLDKRLKGAEEVLGNRPAGDYPADLRDVKKVVDQLDRTVDDLKERVKRLEAKK